MIRTVRVRVQYRPCVVFVALLVSAGWAALAPYVGTWVGLHVAVAPSVEVVDHVVPGVIAGAIGGFALASGRLPLAVALLAVLAGFWMLMTHIPLVDQARRGGVSMAAAVWHTAPGVVVFALAGVAAIRSWNETEESA